MKLYLHSSIYLRALYIIIAVWKNGRQFHSDLQEIERDYMLNLPELESRQRQDIFLFPK